MTLEQLREEWAAAAIAVAAQVDFLDRYQHDASPAARDAWQNLLRERLDRYRAATEAYIGTNKETPAEDQLDGRTITERNGND